jgi:solute carrier family 35, member E3
MNTQSQQLCCSWSAQGSLGSVAFMNLNLAYNSVGFYQLSKLVCIPFTIAVQRICFGIEASMRVKLTLIPILLGVGLATVHDIAVNFRGTIFAILAVVFTSFSQIFTQSYQQSLDCNALQLLYLTSPIIMTGMLLLTPFFDDTRKLWNTEWTNGLVGWILVSCSLALGVNISNYLVLGKTSPLTYQVRMLIGWDAMISRVHMQLCDEGPTELLRPGQVQSCIILSPCGGPH